MKKIQSLAALLMVVVLLAGCGASASKSPAAISNDKIEIQKYKGLKILKYEMEEVTDASVEENIQYMVDLSSERISFSDRPVEPDDYVVLKIRCEIDGQPYEYLCYDGTELMIPHAEELDMESDDLLNMIAMQTAEHTVGDHLSFDTAIPNGYSVFPEIAGKTAHWDVEILEGVAYKQSEFDDAFVANQDIDGVNTVEEYRAFMKDQLEMYEKSTARYALQDEVLEALMAQVSLPAYPQEEIDAYVDEYLMSYRDNAEMLNISYDEYIEEYMGCSVEEFEEQILATADQYVTEDLAIDAIAEAEGLVVTDEIYAAEADAYAQEYNYDNAVALEAAFGKTSIIASMQRDKVLDYLVEQAEQVDEVPAEEMINDAKEESTKISKLLYVTIGLAAALLVVLVVLVVVIVKNRKNRMDEE